MARIVLGAGTSHTPVFTLESTGWHYRSPADRANPALNLSDGRWVTYNELPAEVGPVYESVAEPAELERKAAPCELALDRVVMDAFEKRDSAALRSLPRCALNSGSCEVLNWVLTAGAVDFMSVQWSDYQPLYRTPAGTGVGAAFVVWRPQADQAAL